MASFSKVRANEGSNLSVGPDGRPLRKGRKGGPSPSDAARLAELRRAAEMVAGRGLPPGAVAVGPDGPRPGDPARYTPARGFGTGTVFVESITGKYRVDFPESLVALVQDGVPRTERHLVALVAAHVLEEARARGGRAPGRARTKRIWDHARALLCVLCTVHPGAGYAFVPGSEWRPYHVFYAEGGWPVDPSAARADLAEAAGDFLASGAAAACEAAFAAGQEAERGCKKLLKSKVSPPGPGQPWSRDEKTVFAMAVARAAERGVDLLDPRVARLVQGEVDWAIGHYRVCNGGKGKWGKARPQDLGEFGY